MIQPRYAAAAADASTSAPAPAEVVLFATLKAVHSRFVLLPATAPLETGGVSAAVPTRLGCALCQEASDVEPRA